MSRFTYGQSDISDLLVRWSYSRIWNPVFLSSMALILISSCASWYELDLGGSKLSKLNLSCHGVSIRSQLASSDFASTSIVLPAVNAGKVFELSRVYDSVIITSISPFHESIFMHPEILRKCNYIPISSTITIRIVKSPRRIYFGRLFTSRTRIWKSRAFVNQRSSTAVGNMVAGGVQEKDPVAVFSDAPAGRIDIAKFVTVQPVKSEM